MKNRKSVLIIIALLILLTAAGAAAHSMRHHGRRVQVGDSIADVRSQFGEPTMKVELGELDDGWRRCKVQLWVYDFFPWRYELRIGRGRILTLKKIRLRHVR